jgi:hypothetical protein
MAFSVAPADAEGVSAARFGLTVDQLNLLESECADLTLPPEFSSRWSGDVSADERADRMRAAEIGLIDQGLVRPTAAVSPRTSVPDGVAARVHPALMGYLALFSEPALQLAVHSWGSGRTIVQALAVRSGFAVSLVRGQRLDGQGTNPLNEDAVELSAFAVPHLVSELLRSLVRLEPADPSAAPSSAQAGSVVLPLTVAQGLVTAVRTGNQDLIRAAALTSGIPEDARIADAAASAIDAGYSVVAQSLTGDSLAVHWFRGENGWIGLSLDTPSVGDDIESTVQFADSSRVRIATSSPAAIVGQITTAVGTLTGVLRG